MQRRYIVLAVVFVLLLVAIGIGFIVQLKQKASVVPLTTAIPGSPSPVPFVAPATVSKSPVATCYAWYIETLSSDAATTGDATYTSQLGTCFTESFMETWPGTREDAGVDPVLLSQDFLSSWATNISVEKVNADTVVVTLGTGEEAQELRVRFAVEGGVTRISSVSLNTEVR